MSPSPQPVEPSGTRPERVIDTGKLVDGTIAVAVLIPAVVYGVVFGIGVHFDVPWIIPPFVVLMVVVAVRLIWNHEREQRRFRERAIEGTAELLGADRTGIRINKARVMELRMRVTVPGQAAFIAIHRTPVPKQHMARLEPGAALKLRVDPDRLSQLDVDWD